MTITTTQAESSINIFYNIAFSDAQAHYADIEMHITGLQQNSLELKMPVWTPGSYLIREFEKNIESLNVSANGNIIPSPKINKNTWHIVTKEVTAITVKYRVYAFEISVRTSFIDAEHAFLSTPGIFVYPAGMLHLPSTIYIKPYNKWTKVSTSLDMVNSDPFCLHSPNYDILFDSPIEIGSQDVFGFEASGVWYEICMQGGGSYDKERLKADIYKIVEQEAAVFGENPNKRYVFIVHNYLKGGGGLEHLSSTVLGASRAAYSSEKDYQNFLGLVAHEYFHLWNVKRLRPVALGPFDYNNENYTTGLWIAEGFTEYYQNVILLRTKLFGIASYFESLESEFNILENQPGRHIQTLAQSSFDAWIKAYRPNENSKNSAISYYNKGAIIAMMLDLEIINNSEGRYCLDDVMRYMYTTCYKTKRQGYTEVEFKKGLEKFAGESLDDFYADYINGLTPVDYSKYLAYAGYKIVDEFAGKNEPSLGISAIVSASKKNLVNTVLRGGAGYIDGINVNDELIAIDGEQIKDTITMLNGKKPGDKIQITVTRDGENMILPVTLLKSNTVKYKIAPVDNPSEIQLNVRKKWLSL